MKKKRSWIEEKEEVIKKGRKGKKSMKKTSGSVRFVKRRKEIKLEK